MYTKKVNIVLVLKELIDYLKYVLTFIQQIFTGCKPVLDSILGVVNIDEEEEEKYTASWNLYCHKKKKVV